MIDKRSYLTIAVAIILITGLLGGIVYMTMKINRLDTSLRSELKRTEAQHRKELSQHDNKLKSLRKYNVTTTQDSEGLQQTAKEESSEATNIDNRTEESGTVDPEEQFRNKLLSEHYSEPIDATWSYETKENLYRNYNSWNHEMLLQVNEYPEFTIESFDCRSQSCLFTTKYHGKEPLQVMEQVNAMITFSDLNCAVLSWPYDEVHDIHQWLILDCVHGG